MTTLSRVAAFTRKGIFIGGGIFGGLLVIALLIMIGTAIKNKFFPTPPAPPTVAYGQLPPIPFPSSAPTQNVSFYIDTISGFLPSFTDRQVVYKINQPQTNLLSYQKAKDLASALGFTDTPTQKSDTVFSFASTNPFPATFTVAIDSFNFTLDSTYLATANIASLAAIPVGQAPTVAQTFFDTANALGDSVDLTKTQTTNRMYDPTGTLIPADKPDDTQVAIVDFVHPDMNNLPAVYAHPPRTNLTAVVVSVNGKPTVIQANKFTYDLVSDVTATYPLKSAQQAFDELQKGKAYIAQYDGKSTSVPIKNVKLAYYFPDTSYGYVVPVVVFSSDTFVAYVNAVADNWVSSSSASLSSPQ